MELTERSLRRARRSTRDCITRVEARAGTPQQKRLRRSSVLCQAWRRRSILALPRAGLMANRWSDSAIEHQRASNIAAALSRRPTTRRLPSKLLPRLLSLAPSLLGTPADKDSQGG